MQTKQEKNILTLFLKNMKTLYSSGNTQHIMQENSSSMNREAINASLLTAITELFLTSQC
jgi:hypothetical protein